jgi:mycothiol synthase
MRHILKLHRDLNADPLPQADHNYTIETFNPALHKQQWLDVNNLAFANHPDQGNWVMQDLENRMAEPWFDADGFFLATQNGIIEGFVSQLRGSIDYEDRDGLTVRVTFPAAG